MMPGIVGMMGRSKAPPKVVTFASNAFDVNLRATFNAYGYAAPVPGDTIIFIVNPGVYIGASSPAAWAMQPGGWGEAGPWSLNLINYGRIQGAGGQGGGTQNYIGSGGGGALYMDRQINMVANGSQIFGGGGGGGSFVLIQGGTVFNAGGGAGYQPGPAGGPGPPGDGWWIMAENGTTEAGGTGFRAINNPSSQGGNGGNPGERGQDGNSGAPGYYQNFDGGPAGWSVYGWGNVAFGNWDSTKQEFVYTGVHGADIRGPIA